MRPPGAAEPRAHRDGTLETSPGNSPMPAHRYPWLLVLVCGSLVITLAAGVRQVSGLFLQPVALDLGLSREAFGTAVAIQNLVWGLSQPIAGLLADRYGARPVAVVCGVLYALGMLVAGFAQDATVFMLGLGLLGGLGQSGTTFAVILAVIGRSAPADARTMALGIGSTAGSLGMFVLVPATSALLGAMDWRTTMWALAGALALIPLLAIALREEGHGAHTAGPKPSARVAIAAAGSDRDFWLLNIGFATCGFQLAFLATYLPTILSDGGLGLAAGATVLAAIGIFNIAGTYACGLAGSRWPKTRVLAVLYVLRGAFILLFLALPMSLPAAIAFGAAMGLLWTGTVPLTNGLVADMWGRRHLAFLFSTVYIGHQIGAFGGAWAGGFAFDRTGSFTPVWLAMIGMSAAAAVMHWLVDESPRPLALREDAA